VTLDDPKQNRYIKVVAVKSTKRRFGYVTDKPYAVKILSKDSVYMSAEKFLTFQNQILPTL
jgi:hypothetical protein